MVAEPNDNTGDEQSVNDETSTSSQLLHSDDDELTSEERKELEQLLEKDDAKEVVMQRSMFSGPLPPPSILEGYDTVLQGGAERIMRLTEREQEHRHFMEKTALTGNVHLDRRGQYLGFIIATIALAAATYLITDGHVISGTLIGSLDIVGLVGVFVYGRHVSSKASRKSDNEEESQPSPSS